MRTIRLAVCPYPYHLSTAPVFHQIRSTLNLYDRLNNQAHALTCWQVYRLASDKTVPVKLRFND
jgi:hypothetical protein